MRTRAAFLVCFVAGCIDLGSPAPPAPAGTIAGSIAYEGTTERSLVVSAWPSLPASGTPLASVTIERPVFPQPYELSGLAPGVMFLTARLADAEGQGEILGSYPSVSEVSAVVLDEGRGLRGADFAIVPEGSQPAGAVVRTDTRVLSGTVDFAGTVGPRDTLRGALYLSYPARGAPADLQIVNVHAPTFPYDFRFTSVRDGAYYTVFYLDRGGDSPFGPGEGDVVAWSLGPDARPVRSAISLGASRAGVNVVIPAR